MDYSEHTTTAFKLYTPPLFAKFRDEIKNSFGPLEDDTEAFGPWDTDEALARSLPPPLISDPQAAAVAVASPSGQLPPGPEPSVRKQGGHSSSVVPPPAFACGDGADLMSLFPCGPAAAAGHVDNNCVSDAMPADLASDSRGCLENFDAMLQTLPAMRAPSGLRRDTSNPWDNVPDQPLVR